MAKLILSLDGVVIRDVKLDKPRVSIGRKPHNDVVIDNLAISGEHALVTVNGDEIVVEDLGSTNGTLVNGQAIKQHRLQDNDLLEIGKYKLKFVEERLRPPPPEDFEKTMIIRAPLAAAPKPTVNAPQAPSAAPAAVAALQILTGSNAGKELELIKNLTTIGKTGVQVAVISRRPHGFYITHVSGPSHPLVNGVEIEAEAHLLKPNDVIELAGIQMKFYVRA